MKYFVLLLPVVFSVAAQIMIKIASCRPYRSTPWFHCIVLSVVFYLAAFILYSMTVRYFPISVAGSVNTIAVMVLVVTLGVLFFGEMFSLTRLLGIILGVLSLCLICYNPS